MNSRLDEPGESGAAPAAAALPTTAASRIARLLADPRSLVLPLLLLCLVMLLALGLGWRWLLLTAAAPLAATALLVLLPPLGRWLRESLGQSGGVQGLAVLALLLAAVGLAQGQGWLEAYLDLWRRGDWNAIGAVGEGVVGAFGQILVALVALTIAWRQVRVDQRLSGQQNRITQGQTIDNFIDGITDLIIDEEGLLEDWPLERMLAEGRTAAVIGSIDAEGKARILRFLSHALLLAPLRRDHRLGRAILDGQGSYEIDWLEGVPVIRLQSMLRGADLRGCDLRGVDLHGADLRGVDFSGSDLSEANLAGADLSGATLDRCCLDGTRFFFGRSQTATPASPGRRAELLSGACSGAVVAQCTFRSARRLDPQQLHYLASWCGSRSRATLPGSGRGIPNQLEAAEALAGKPRQSLP